jgi:hypothetical protein
MKEFKIENHEPSILPVGDWELVWSDEFDGEELNRTKWDFRLFFWGKKSPTFCDKVTVSDSELHIPLLYENGVYRSAHLQTGSLTYDLPKDSDGFWPFGEKKNPLFMHKYGYYEIRCKLPTNSGWHAAFWLQAPGIGTHPDPAQCGIECDIMENYNQNTEGVIIGGIGYNGYGKESVWPGHFKAKLKETADGYHRFAVDWSENGYIFYYDGEEVGRQMAPQVPVSNVEQFILVSTECHGYHRAFGNEAAEASLAGDAEVWAGKPVKELTEATLPDEFIVDYVRVFDRKDN